MLSRRKVGLVLSGGGARGLAHIGVLKVLARESIPFDLIAASSMGGLIGAAYASGMSAADLEAEALRMSRLRALARLVDWLPPRRGLIGGHRLHRYLVEGLGLGGSFEALRLPMALVAVDLCTFEEVRLTEGNLAQAVLATSAVPGIFPPVEREGRRLVDGGVLNNLPVDVARDMGADDVIAVDVGPVLEQGPPMDLESIGLMPDFAKDVYLASLAMHSALKAARMREWSPEVLIRPDIPLGVSLFIGFSRAAELIEIGEQAAERALPELRRLTRPTFTQSLGRAWARLARPHS